MANVPGTGGWRLLCIVVVAWASLMPAGVEAFDLQGHRGARGLAPENTLPAFRAAMALGVHTLELDVHVTADGVVVLSHDPRLNADFTRDAQGRWIEPPGAPVISLTLAELQRHDVGRGRPGSAYLRQWPELRGEDGVPMPTLTAVFALVKASGGSHLRFNVETKLDPRAPALTPPPLAYAEAVLAVVREHGMQERVTIQSFDWRTLREVQRLAPTIPTAALSSGPQWLAATANGEWTAGLRLAEHGGSMPRMVHALGARLWSPAHAELTPALLAEAHRLGLRVVPWTVNDPAIMERLIDWGVDGLITDYPDRARTAMARKGLALPPAVPGLR